MKTSCLLVVVFLSACSFGKKEEKIGLPKVSKEFYQSALSKVQEEYDLSPTDELLKLKFYYYEKLGWPQASKADLDAYLEKHGLDKHIVDLYLRYFLSNDQHAELVSFLDKWEFYNGLDNELARYRILSNIKAKGSKGTGALLDEYLDKFPYLDSYEFAVEETKKLKDTAMMRTYLRPLADRSPTHRLISDLYIPLLLSHKEGITAYQLLSTHQVLREGDQGLVQYARALYQMDSTRAAVTMMRQVDSETANLLLSHWYRDLKAYDSAVYFVNKILHKDSARQYLYLKAEIQEERGWIYSANSLYRYLLSTDSTDLIARKRTEILARKIAYLRSLEEQERNVPVPNIEPKKLSDE